MTSSLIEFDKNHLWHPYTSMLTPLPAYHVEKASGVRLFLKDGRALVDGMSSWWASIHGYNHPVLNRAVTDQLDKMSHVMFGGITHEPAVSLAKRLIDLAPSGLEKLFLSDSGSVSVEVAMKMAFQYWHAKGHPDKYRLLTVRSGYHGDTFAAMSVCDPVNGMHHKFKNILQGHYFAPRPETRFGDRFDESAIEEFKDLLRRHHQTIAAVILEPIVQGTGGMRFYSPDYLRRVRELCDEFDVLLIFDEIATGFGRTGEMFAANHAHISPDIMCVGKALTGGYMTLAATLASDKVCDGIAQDHAGVLMHGPTFMANPLACAVAIASIRLLLSQDWQRKIHAIEHQLHLELKPLIDTPTVEDVRVLGAIGVVEMKEPVNVAEIQQQFVDRGVWIRPFGRLIYLMPPYIIDPEDLSRLTGAIADVV